MKAVWIGIGIVCVAVLAITVAFITTPHDFREEENRSDGTLLHTLEDEPLEKYVPFSYDPYLDENMQKIVQKDLLMAMGDSVTLYADIDESEDLLLFANIIFVRDITVRKPDGSVSLYTDRPPGIFNHPLVIPVDEAGTWSVTVTRQTDEELYEEMRSHYPPHIILSDDAEPPQFCSLLLAARPAAVELDLPKVTDDPYLLSTLVADISGTVVVTENEEPLSLSQPLDEGRHFLRFQRMMSDGRISKATHFDLMVDTIAPEITLGDFERETNFPYVLLNLTLSDNVMAFYINGGLYSHTERLTEIQERMPLEMGANLFELRAVSFAGQEARCTVTVTRIDSERDQT